MRFGKIKAPTILNVNIFTFVAATKKTSGRVVPGEHKKKVWKRGVAYPPEEKKKNPRSQKLVFTYWMLTFLMNGLWFDHTTSKSDSRRPYSCVQILGRGRSAHYLDIFAAAVLQTVFLACRKPEQTFWATCWDKTMSSMLFEKLWEEGQGVKKPPFLLDIFWEHSELRSWTRFEAHHSRRTREMHLRMTKWFTTFSQSVKL